ncbi:MAG TPA: LysR substrate-binding domain-containing protein [Candidatus Lustribacter sp.]|jgi:DNA-binding transcriptional LysR family regulator|nr:LysR substrate-binding domain-containing protein [Candidatus Lustribacter sp.]
MELRHLRYFVAVAEHLHFGRAADALATAQPSLSRQILQLEDELGVKLFERTNRRVELTDAGRTFLADARRTLEAADASVRHVRENAEGTRGELRLAFIAGAMMSVLPDVLREYRRRYPNVVVVPHALPYNEHFPALHAGTIDLAWTIPIPDPEITSRVITSDGLLVVLPSDHRLAGERVIEVARLAGDALITIARAEAPMFHNITLEVCLSNGFRPDVIHEVFDMGTILGLAAAGFGVGLIPFPWSALHVPGIVFRELAIDLAVDETLSWRTDRHTPIVRTFVDTAVELLATRGVPHLS